MANPRLHPDRRTLGAAKNSLLNNLLGYWELDESSGNRADSSGNGNTMADNNTVTSNTGKTSPLAAEFLKSNSEYLSNAGWSLTNGLSTCTICYWVYFAPAEIGSGNFNYTVGAGSQILLRKSTGDTMVTQWNTSAGNAVVGSSTFGALSASTWYWVVHEYVGSTGRAYIRINNATNDASSAIGAGTLSTATNDLTLAGGTPGSPSFSGRIQQVCIWDRILTTAERNQIYNGGSGISSIITGS